MNVLDVLFEIALGGADLVAERAADHPVPHHHNIVAEAAGCGRRLTGSG
jgi:hypothetical protein